MRYVEVNPRDDVDFVALVDSLSEDTERPQDLQRLLRKSHPSAVVRARELAAETHEVWYVYRDGTWRRPGSGQTG